MKKNNLSLDFSLENRLYHNTFKKIIKIILIYLIFKLILAVFFMYNVYIFKQEFLYGKKLVFEVDGIVYKIDTIEEKKEIIDLITDFSNKSERIYFAPYKCLPRVEISTDSYYVNAYECYDYYFSFSGFRLINYSVGGRYLKEESLNKLFEKYGKKEFHTFEGEFSNISDVYKQIRENYRSFDVNSYIEDKEDIDGKTIYHLYKKYKGAKLLDGYEIVVKDNRFKVTKVENKKFDIKVDDALSKFGIDRYLKYREDKTGEKLKVIKTEFIHQDGKFYNRYEIEVIFDVKKSIIFLYEEKYVEK
ncbi:MULTISPECIES: hypothetical protein [unclassified Parvimonas]|uniref:hypothetical protein n=1 Tax=unclassified Parvimonas TaxID=1151464 RepID=UPI002B480167|nr:MULTISPECIES: hypothetical protein [unclassified Parvimonas]MEB3025302.1 hypothetical protein [Parvimonas sp. M13]MEB3089454.1 hypothetical protein [Parvimonas sp. M20]